MAGVEPGRCAYVGDQPSRDVAGCKRAGFALSIIIESGAPMAVSQDELLKPDFTIHRLSELLDIFQSRVKK